MTETIQSDKPAVWPVSKPQLDRARSRLIDKLGEEETVAARPVGAKWDSLRTIDALIDSATDTPDGP